MFYKKVETTETSTTESSSSEKGEGSGSSNSGSSNSGKGSSSSKEYVPVKNLPKTGEKQRNIIYVVFGLMILSIAGIIFKKKSTR
ncbi:LPXTG cell wall anchor domain-containing protein [Vagococcus fluvialis]|uniref:LPXTG cell wall anchor domain-containing protein n=1 Tax=Vagococcus fluvialis TaxID=2738 RepID=A0A7X6I332_9ENTE|nr:LPXTG cell wall anchor domain-containing protein [Vagococcus fluvialis]